MKMMGLVEDFQFLTEQLQSNKTYLNILNAVWFLIDFKTVTIDI